MPVPLCSTAAMRLSLFAGSLQRLPRGNSLKPPRHPSPQQVALEAIGCGVRCAWRPWQNPGALVQTPRRRKLDSPSHVDLVACQHEPPAHGLLYHVVVTGPSRKPGTKRKRRSPTSSLPDPDVMPCLRSLRRGLRLNAQPGRQNCRPPGVQRLESAVSRSGIVSHSMRRYEKASQYLGPDRGDQTGDSCSNRNEPNTATTIS